VLEFSRTIPAEPAVLSAVRHDLRDWAQDVGLGTPRIERLLLACQEALANAVEHGYRDTADGRVEVRVALDDHRCLTAVVTDHGRWLPPVVSPPRTHPDLRGRGLTLMRALMQTVDVTATSRGTTVRMTERARFPAEAGRWPTT
jgi:anti-sigma regulatory factor (Ser/Thr protein kinase)